MVPPNPTGRYPIVPPNFPWVGMLCHECFLSFTAYSKGDRFILRGSKCFLLLLLPLVFSPDFVATSVFSVRVMASFFRAAVLSRHVRALVSPRLCPSNHRGDDIRRGNHSSLTERKDLVVEPRQSSLNGCIHQHTGCPLWNGEEG